MQQIRSILTTLLVATVVGRSALADYPCWRGENGDGRGGDCGEEMVDTLEDARLVWRSEARTYQSYPENGIGAPYLYTGQGGPVLAEGRVFFNYFLPDGRVYNKKAAAAFENREFNPAKIGFDSKYELGKCYYGVTAEDVFLCCDAKTGKTLWQRNIPGGMNYGGRRGGWAGTKAGPLLTPCAAYGKVFFVGSTFRVFALDAKTGETVWESNLGPAYDRIQRSLKSATAARDLWKLPVDWFLGGFPTTYADGVFCTSDGMKGMWGPLMGFDAETGEVLWKTDFDDSYPAPVRWQYGGKEYFVSGKCALIEPKTGKALWGPLENLTLVTLSKNHLIGSIQTPGVKGFQGWKCLRITPEKAEAVWTSRSATLNAGWAVPVATHGHVVWVADKAFRSLDIATGKSMHSTEKSSPGSRTRCALVCGDGAIIQENSDVVNIAPDGSLTGGLTCKGRIPGQPDMKYSNTTTGFIDDGYWYFRAAHSLACINLRKELHPAVRAAAGDSAKLIALCRDANPALSVDAVVALARSGDRSDPVIAAMVGCLDRPKSGAAVEAGKYLSTITPPPRPLLAAAASTDPDLRLGALRSLSALEGLPVKVLAMAAAEPLFRMAEEAAELLATRCKQDLSMLVDTIAEVNSDSVRGRLLELLRENMNRKTAPTVMKQVKARFGGASPDSARGLLQCAAAVGDADAWAYLSGMVADKKHPYRVAAIDALRRWPNDDPVSTLDAVVSDASEQEKVRAASLRAMLPMLEYRAGLKATGQRAAVIEAKLPAAKQLGLEPEFIEALGRTGSLQALLTLGAYIGNPEFSENAVEAIQKICKTLDRKEMLGSAARLDVLAEEATDREIKETLTDLAARLRDKHERTAPALGDLMEDGDLGLGL